MKLYKYKYDLHVHTSNVSPCAHVPAHEIVHLYKQAGYQGIVITDHYYDHYFETLPESTWADKIKRYMEGYRIARDEGQKLDLDVLFGIELKMAGTQNDYLIYGVTEDFLVEYPELYKLSLAALHSLTKANGMLLYVAHPFRSYMQPVDPRLLDGAEVFNGNPRHKSQNHLALAFAEEHGLLKISGSDFHQRVDLGIGGVALKERVTDIHDLVPILRAEDLGLITNPLPKLSFG